mmetsp:Transcript_27915/g.64665  ORF Transcript_27915/g.64665 Transcript_27915/m.64665 type:complete len:286 (-) Transcript_27915:210-1067(-)
MESSTNKTLRPWETHSKSGQKGTAQNENIHPESLTRKLILDGVQLETDALFTGGLSGHDEGAGNVTVLDKAFPKGPSQSIGSLEGRRTGRVRNRHDHIDIVIGMDPHHLFGELLAHLETCLVDTDPVHDGIRTSKVHVLENTWRRLRGRIANPRVTSTRVHVHKDGLSGLDITYEIKSEGINGDGFTGHDIVKCLFHSHDGIGRHAGLARSKDHGSDAMWITKADQSHSVDEIHACVSSLTFLHDRFHGTKDGFHHIALLVGSCQAFGKDIQKELGIRIRIDMSS